MNKTTCDECGGTGSTVGNHVENCDIEDCPICASDEECPECHGTGEVDDEEDEAAE